MRLTREQVREIDRRSIEDFHIPGIVLMENAARGVADIASEMLGVGESRHVLILCGGGNNGGDGLAAARHLHNRGYAVQIALTLDPSRYKGDALINWRIVQAMRLPVVTATPDLVTRSNPALMIDAIFGTGLSEAPRPPFDEIAAAVNASKVPVLAVDIPSGMDCNTGTVLGACIRAEKTVTFVAEKAGFADPTARQYLGEIAVADIGCPRELIPVAAGAQTLP